MRKVALTTVAVLLVILVAFGLLRDRAGISNEAPPRSKEEFVGQVGRSTISLPVGADLTRLSKNLEREIPTQLWSVDRAEQVCVPSKKVKVLVVKLKTPTIKCRIVGEVTRGKISITGRGKDIYATMPVSATIRAKDVGGILKQETAQARAVVRVKLRLDVSQQWTASGKVDIDYKWTDSPHLDFLGQRIDLSEAADAKLQTVVAGLEKSLARELSKLPLRSEAEAAWNSAFTSINLNEKNPPVWMRVTPREVHYSGYEIENGRLSLRLRLTAKTETFIGDRPSDPVRVPLPPLVQSDAAANAFRLNIPVIADYRTLEPILARALAKREKQPFDLPSIGLVMAKFDKVTMYATGKDKIAVGLRFSATTAAGTQSKGTVWFTATPVNKPNSPTVSFTDLQVSGVTDSLSANLLLELANSPGLSELIAKELRQNFAKDFRSLRSKIDVALAHRQDGNLSIAANITDIQTGRLKATGAGLYLPVVVRGTARVQIRQ